MSKASRSRVIGARSTAAVLCLVLVAGALALDAHRASADVTPGAGEVLGALYNESSGAETSCADFDGNYFQGEWCASLLVGTPWTQATLSIGDEQYSGWFGLLLEGNDGNSLADAGSFKFSLQAIDGTVRVNPPPDPTTLGIHLPYATGTGTYHRAGPASGLDLEGLSGLFEATMSGTAHGCEWGCAQEEITIVLKGVMEDAVNHWQPGMGACEGGCTFGGSYAQGGDTFGPGVELLGEEIGQGRGSAEVGLSQDSAEYWMGGASLRGVLSAGSTSVGEGWISWEGSGSLAEPSGAIDFVRMWWGDDLGQTFSMRFWPSGTGSFSRAPLPTGLGYLLEMESTVTGEFCPVLGDCRPETVRITISAITESEDCDPETPLQGTLHGCHSWGRYVQGWNRAAVEAVAAPPNDPPSAPTLVAPADGETVAHDDPQVFAIEATDPDEDPYVGVVTVTEAPTGQSTSFKTLPAASGSQSSGAPAPPLPPGSYTWSAVAQDSKGEESPPSVSRSFTVAAPPTTVATVVVFDPPVVEGPVGEALDAGFQAFDEQGQPLVEATVHYTVAPAGSTAGGAGSTTTDPDGKGSISVTPVVWPLQVLAYADEAGVGSAGSRDPSEVLGTAVVVGTTTDLTASDPPTAPTLVAPADDAVFTRDDVQELVVRATDPDGEPWTGKVTVTNTETEETTVFTTAPARSGHDATAVPAPPLEPGEYTWSAIARDARGLESPESDTRGFTVLGNRPPSVPVLVDPDHDRRFSLDAPQSFTVSTTDPDGDPYSATITVREADTDTEVASIATTVAASGEDSSSVPAAPLEPGSYTWTAKAEDVHGAASEESEPRAFTVANLPPTTPTLLSPRPAETLSTEGLQTFTVSATDPDDDPYTATITVRDAGSASVVASFPTTASSSGDDATGTPGQPLPAGAYTWTATAEDVHGAASEESEPRAFNVSVNRPPGPPGLLSPGNGEVFHLNDPQVFTIQAEDPEGSPYTGTVTATNTGTGATTSFDTSPAPSGSQSSGSPTVPLAAGSYTWRATATDAFGITGLSSVSRSFTVSADLSPAPAALPAEGPMTRVSVSSTGGQSNDNSWFPSISGDGRYVAFGSYAKNLAPTASNGNHHIFVRDRITGVTEHVSVSSLGAQGNDDSWIPSISGDGRYVAFESYATNLVSGTTNNTSDVFVHDRITKQTTRVSVSSSGAQGNGWSGSAAISGDGRYVAFLSGASNLVSGDTNGVGDIFVRDQVNGTTQRVSVSSSGAQGTPGGIWWGYMSEPSISSNGRYVAFASAFTNLVSGDTNDTLDAFIRDRTTGTTQRVSVSSSGGQGNGASLDASVSDNGRYVAFTSRASNLAGGGNGWDQIYVRDRTAGTTLRVSNSQSGAIGNAWSARPSISGDGRYVAFGSSASNLVPGDRNGQPDVFLRDRSTGLTTLMSHTTDGLQASSPCHFCHFPYPSVSDDGLHVAFDSDAANLVSGDTNARTDIFAYNRQMSLECAGGSLSTVGCLSGYGFKATSSKTGLENFYPYHPFDLGSGQRAFLNTHNGNLVVQATDLEVPGQGLNLRLTRTYNSQWDHGPGPLGQGWRLGIVEGDADDLLGSITSALLSADVGQLLEVVATEDQFDFFDATGTRHHFVKGGLAGPGWHSPPGVNLTLSDYMSGGQRRYRATRPDGVTYEFRPVSGGSYGLRLITDRKGNSLTFNYSSGRLSSVTDTTGRSLTFSWSGDYVSSVTFSGSGSTRTVNYNVDAWDGRLISVTTAGRTVSYTYGTRGLATVKDGRNNTSTFTLNQSGMLTRLRDRANQNWNVAYNTASCQPGAEGAAVAACVTDPEGGTTTYTTSAAGNLLSYRDAGDTAPNSREYLWEANRLVWEADEVGNTTEYAYNRWGQVVLKRESGGHDASTSVFSYREVSPGVSDLVAARTGVGSGDERVWRFGLAENGDLRSTTDPEGNITTFSHYERGLLESVTDPRGHTTTYGNTSAADGGYHPTGQPPSVTDAAGHTMSFTYDFLGRLTSRVDRNANTWSFAYDARGNLTSQAVPGGGTTTYAYDVNGNLTSTTPPGGATVTNTYDARGQITATQATIGGVLRKTTYGYDKAGRLVEILEPRTFAGSPAVTQKVTYEYFPNHRMRAMIDEEGNRTDLTYTPDGNIQTVRRPAGSSGRHSTTYTYNRRGQVTSGLESGHSRPTLHSYSPHGERLHTTTPKGATTRFAYDKAGRLTRTTDANGNDSNRTYDPAGNLMRITQPTGDGWDITTSYSYTPRGEIASETDPSDGAHTITYAYDPEGRQTFRRDRYNGSVIRTVEQSFRADGALLERKATASGRPTHRSTYSYDAAGNMTAANAWLGGSQVSEVSVSHNAAFEPTSVTERLYPPSGPAVTKTASYTYQPDGLLASRTIDGKTTNYSHSLSGQEAKTELWGNGPAASRTRTTTYLPNGAPDQITLPNAVAARHRYDPASRLTTRTFSPPGAGEVSSWEAITYDDDDHRTAETVTQRQPNGSTVPLKAGQATYAYDALGRLISAKHPFDPEPATYELDDAGNVIRESGPNSRADYYYWMNRLGSKFFSGEETTTEGGVETKVVSSGRSVYSYDPLGDLTRAQTDMRSVVSFTQGQEGEESGTIVDFPNISNITTTTYDAASHTKRVKESDGSWVDYAYDALSRLVRRVEHPAQGADVVTLFFHDGASESVALETNASGTVQARYLLDSAGAPLGQEDGKGRSYFVDDPRGNVTQLVGQDRGVKAVFGYDPFGKGRGAHTTTTEDWDSRLRFQTAPKDPKTGAYALGPRMYDPSINRFVGADHYVGAAANMSLAADPLTGNRYLYAGANPVGMIDDGHSPYFYSAQWHPTSWHVRVSYRWRVSWKFYTWGSANFHRQDGYDTHHHIDSQFRYKAVTYIRILEGQWGRNDRSWAALNAGIDKYQRQAYAMAVRQAGAAVQSAFNKYLGAEPWRNSGCRSPITKWVTDWLGLYPPSLKGGLSFAGTTGAIKGIGMLGSRGAAAARFLNPVSITATAGATILGVACR